VYTQKEEFQDIVRLLNDVDQYRRTIFIRQLFKAVGDRAGPDISERPHNEGDTPRQHALEPISVILQKILSNTLEDIMEEK
jgi:hypothetical protein